MGDTQAAGTRRTSQANAQPAQQMDRMEKTGRCAQMRKWTQKNQVETGLIIANVLVILAVVAMGIAGTCFGKGISFQDMFKGDAWKVSVIALATLLGIDLIIAGSTKYYKQRQAQKEKQAQQNENGVANAHADAGFARFTAEELAADGVGAPPLDTRTAKQKAADELLDSMTSDRFKSSRS